MVKGVVYLVVELRYMLRNPNNCHTNFVNLITGKLVLKKKRKKDDLLSKLTVSV